LIKVKHQVKKIANINLIGCLLKYLNQIWKRHVQKKHKLMYGICKKADNFIWQKLLLLFIVVILELIF